MTDAQRHKLRRPPETPGPEITAIQQLHEKIQEGREVTRGVRAVLGEIRKLVDEFNAQADRICNETSEEAIQARIDRLLTDEAILARVEPAILGMQDAISNFTDKLIATGNEAKEILQKREAALVEIIGAGKREDFIEELAALIAGDVLREVAEIQATEKRTAASMESLLSVLPDMEQIIDLRTPKPPPKKQPRHSRNQHRRRR